ncbi:MAG: type II toxin-antitoxin system YafQ family toxin [Arcobacteraceae bacterium]|jgi:mRNA interferase YafQ|nr:type II toxin-antitoxin system YafQ family toxin [Arcobacteraceae bacterium]
MYQIFRTSAFKKDYKKLSPQDKEEVKRIIIRLANNEVLDPKYKDHKLIGNYKDCKECHIKPDLLLIYRIDANILELALVRTGNHSELFR